MRVVRRMLQELEAAGYLTRQRYRDERGRIGWKHVVHDEPVPAEQRTSGAFRATGSDQEGDGVPAGETTGAFCTGGERADIGSKSEGASSTPSESGAAPPAEEP